MTDKLNPGDRKVFFIQSLSPIYHIINGLHDGQPVDILVRPEQVQVGELVVLELCGVTSGNRYHWLKVKEKEVPNE